MSSLQIGVNESTILDRLAVLDRLIAPLSVDSGLPAGAAPAPDPSSAIVQISASAAKTAATADGIGIHLASGCWLSGMFR